MTFWAENQSFRSKSGKTQPIRTKFGIRRHIKGWHCLDKFERELFCVVNQTTFRKFRNGRFPPNLVTKCISASCRGIRKDIFENFHFRGHFPPKSEIENRSNRHITQSRLQVTWCTAEGREILFTPRCSQKGPGIFRGPVNFCLRRTVAELGLRDVKIAQFSDFGLFSPYKTLRPKTYFPVISLQPRGYTSQNNSDFSMW